MSKNNMQSIEDVLFGIKLGKIIWIIVSTVFGIVSVIIMLNNSDVKYIRTPNLAIAKIVSSEYYFNRSYDRKKHNYGNN